MTVARSSGARRNASRMSSPNVCASGKSTKLTRTVPLVSRARVMGFSMVLSLNFASGPVTGSALDGKNLSASLGVVALLQAEVLFDAIHETGAQLLLLAVRRKNRHLRAESNNEMAAVSRLECAALLVQPSLEFLTRHILDSSQTDDTTVVLRCKQMCCVERFEW